jgi:hypothetical protein
MRTTLRLVIGLSLVVGLAAACSSSGSGGGGGGPGTCDAPCGCVAQQGGDPAECQQICAETISHGGNVKANCEALLDSYGYPSCKPKCEGFPTG